jgi:hypothetical protein
VSPIVQLPTVTRSEIQSKQWPVPSILATRQPKHPARQLASWRRPVILIARGTPVIVKVDLGLVLPPGTQEPRNPGTSERRNPSSTRRSSTSRHQATLAQLPACPLLAPICLHRSPINRSHHIIRPCLGPAIPRPRQQRQQWQTKASQTTTRCWRSSAVSRDHARMHLRGAPG